MRFVVIRHVDRIITVVLILNSHIAIVLYPETKELFDYRYCGWVLLYVFKCTMFGNSKRGNKLMHMELEALNG